MGMIEEFIGGIMDSAPESIRRHGSAESWVIDTIAIRSQWLKRLDRSIIETRRRTAREAPNAPPSPAAEAQHNHKKARLPDLYLYRAATRELS